ncbi:MAG: hypothetical protein QXR53_04175 [Candidatus Norongarragalinales archaeon]
MSLCSGVFQIFVFSIEKSLGWRIFTCFSESIALVFRPFFRSFFKNLPMSIAFGSKPVSALAKSALPKTFSFTAYAVSAYFRAVFYRKQSPAKTKQADFVCFRKNLPSLVFLRALFYKIFGQTCPVVFFVFDETTKQTTSSVFP